MAGSNVKIGSRRFLQIRLHCRGPGSGNAYEATNQKQFPYMEILDSNGAQQDY